MPSRIISPAGLSVRYFFRGRKTVRNARYFIQDDTVLLHPGDNSSEGLPYFLDLTRVDDNRVRYTDAAGNTQTAHIDELAVLIYQPHSGLRYMSPETQIDELEDFLSQFPADMLLRRFLNNNLLNWLRRNTDRPDIWGELVSTKNRLHYCEDAIRRHEIEKELSHDDASN
jgi:hypothetical protein